MIARTFDIQVRKADEDDHPTEVELRVEFLDGVKAIGRVCAPAGQNLAHYLRDLKDWLKPFDAPPGGT